MNNPLLLRFFPFLSWFPVSNTVLQGDIIAGITGALVLVPKAMAYAQLSGLPVYFGLYVALVPAVLGALWGSSRQLATGPVAIVSLMTAAAITPFAAPFSQEFIGLALLLALLVGVVQFALGVFKLGIIVNFVSHPVILGFMNAAAIIIALSQLDMLLGIPKGRSESFLYDIWEMLGYLPQAHLPTLAMSVFALALMLGLKKIPQLAKLSVLAAVVVTIIVSALLDFEHKTNNLPEQIADPASQALVIAYAEADKRILAMNAEITALSSQERKAAQVQDARTLADLNYKIELKRLDVVALEEENKERLHAIRKLDFERAKADEARAAALYLRGHVPEGVETDGRKWHIKKIEKGEVKLVGGGDVVGKIPSGLPAFRVPPLSLELIVQLLSAAFIIALVGFMESISMAKALAAKTKQRLDPNQELIGQGLANIGGAFFQSYPACGSFTGSAINLQAGAKTGFAMIFNGLFVAVTLLFLTDFLYYLPKATLAVIILLAVTSLVTPKALKHTWQASRFDGIVALTTFVITLLAAPHLDKGIMIGAGLAIVLYLYRTMKPRVAQLGRYPDGTLRDIRVNPTLPTSPHIIAMRFDGSLYFANIAYFEDTVLEMVAAKPRAKYLLVVGDAINQLDASGEEVIHHLVERLRDNGMDVVFSGLKKQILDVMRGTGLIGLIGEGNIFPTEDMAIEAIYERLGDAAGEDLFCPLPARA
ncbi:MAG: SulP family inorganic anion transporter [Gammaproteobacteria bacterium]|nr:SulP family inorganic anion transporter [Gammaproteobacteria bacterium]MBU1653242.1 SulP family inorganic anion transporter [Gammaproteobacteria bacterium]MBU1961046.1 SulP family inorganic anion transporter [Gammaproteobacteria bacterium]